MASYDHQEIERKWQKKWAKEKAWVAKEDPKADARYHLVMFPYPSGAGLHVGHVES
jgi:leucyl-tRNA synthetase